MNRRGTSATRHFGEHFGLIFLLLFTGATACPSASHARVTVDPKVTVELYNDGCDSYERDDFAGAKDRFLAAALTRWQNPALFYNLGNCYFRLGDLGRAILYYEKAKRLAPRDASIAYNLDLTRSRIIDKVEPTERNILVQLFVDVYSLFNVNEWTAISLSLYLALMAVVIAVILLKGEAIDEGEGARRSARRILAQIAVILAILTALSATSTLVKARAFNAGDCGIVVADAVKARSGPKDEFAEVFELHSGTKVRIQATRDDWHQISIETGLSGWLPKESVEIVNGTS
ncbi:MAG: tetratricopeptide repeat protein [Candidatus Coatesbacteria bacterium]|nr:tetratricopeptide repeat protein [Candidatus Coatesbacteria bacterium]